MPPRSGYFYSLPVVRCGNTRHGDGFCGLRRFDLGFLPGPRCKFELKASCADLSLCSKNDSSKTVVFYVCNLRTKQWVALPPAPHFQEDAIGFLCVPAPCSLCYPGRECLDNSHCKFMVVRICILPLSQYKVQLFSSEEGQWKTCVVSSPRTFCHGKKSCKVLVPYKGMLHWLISDCVLVFDPYNAPESLSRVIDLPPSPTNILHPYMQCLGVCQDRLRVSLQYNAYPLQDPGYDIWELKDYNMGEWSLVPKFYTKDLDLICLHDHFIIQKKGYVQPDGHFVYMSKFSIWICNLQNGRYDHQFELIDLCPGQVELIFSHQNVHPITDQWWPTPVPSVKKGSSTMNKRMKLSDSSSNFFNNLVENLLVEILARLPSRAAFQLKLVCRRWCSLISSKYFVTFFNHRRHDPSLPPIHDPHSSSSSFVFQPHRGDYRLRIVRCGCTHSDTNLCGIRKLDLSFLRCPQREILLRASCADLVLFSTLSPTIFYVCNPLTKQWVALPPPPKFRTLPTGFLCVPASCSLCHPGTQCVDNSHYNFMVVQIGIDQFHLPHSQYKIQLFSSEEGQWRTLVVSSPRTSIFWDSSVDLIPYKGMLHWLISRHVLVYDPYNSPEKFSRVIELPLEQQGYVKSFGVYQDRLRLALCKDQDRPYYIWELQDYKMGKWSLVHTICHSSLHLMAPDLLIKIKGPLQIDGSIFYSTDSCVWLGNVQTGRMDHQYELPDVGFGLPSVNVHWIADQWWPTPVPSLSYTIKNSENTLRIRRKKAKKKDKR